MSDHELSRFSVSEVPEEWLGHRLDKIIVTHLIELSRSRIQALIDSDKILINGKSTKASYKLRSGDLIHYEIPEPEPSELIPEDIPLEIIYEDKDIVVVNKERNTVVHPGAGIQTGTLVHALLHHCGDLSGIGGVLRPGIVHRLDRGTSGVIVAAKNDSAHNHLVNQFAERTTRKFYVAIVSGNPLWAEETVDQPIGRHPNQRIRMMVTPDGRSAITRFTLLASGNSASYVLAELLTGRTHQIRVHLEHLRYPVLGDAVYGIHCRKPIASRIKPLVKKIDGFCLHAFSLGVTHPATGEFIRFRATVPNDMREILDRLDLENTVGHQWRDYI